MNGHRFLEVRHLHVIERSDVHRAGVVDEDVDASGPRDHVADEPFRFIAPPQIADGRGDVDAAGLEVRARALELVSVARRQRDARAFGYRAGAR